MNYRPLRVGKLLREELAILIEKEIELDGALATITEVEVDKKLEHAKVRLSILPSKAAEQGIKIFHSAQGHLQYLLMKKLNIKPMPRIEFVLDYGPEHAAKVEKILLKEENNL